MIETNNEERLRAAIRQLILIEKVALGDEVPMRKLELTGYDRLLRKLFLPLKAIIWQ